MLFTKCAATLAANRSLVLIALPLTAVLQVMSPLVLSLATTALPQTLGATSWLCNQHVLVPPLGFAFRKESIVHIRVF